MVKPVVVSIVADARGARKGVQETEGLLSRLGGAIKRYGKFAAVGLAAATTALVVSSVGLASEAEQSIGAVEQIYGKHADGVVAKSKKAALEVGLSANAYRELSNGMGAMLKNAGTPMDQLAGKTDKLVGLGADLAATFGGSTSDAVAAIGSLMRGEANPIEKYGVAIKQSDVNARLAAQGLKGLTGEKLREAEATARLELLYQQTASAQGQFGRESSTLAGQQQRMAAQWENMQVSLGTKFLPVLTRTFEWLNDKGPKAWAALESAANKMKPVLTRVVGVVTDLWGIFTDVKDVIGDNIGVIATLAGGYAAYKAITLGVAAAEWAVYLWQSRSVLLGATRIAITKAMTASQLGLNAAMRANPLGLIITGITLLIAGFVWAYKNVDWFREGVQTAFAGVVAAGKWLWAGIKIAWDKIVGAAGIASKLVRGYFGMWVSAFKFVINGAQTLYAKVTGFFGGVASKVGELKGRVTGALKNAGDWLKDAGKKIIQGLINGISAKFGAVKDKLGNLTDKITDWKGPASRDRRLLEPAADLIMGGFIAQIDANRAALRGVLGEVTTDISTITMGPPRLSYNGRLADRSSTSGGVTNIYITVDVPVTADSAAVGKEVAKTLAAYFRSGGVRP